MRRIRLLTVPGLLLVLQACGGDENLLYACDEVQSYVTLQDGRRIEVPNDLDPLNELAEMPVPRSQDAPPPSQRCIELPPSVRVKSASDTPKPEATTE